MGTMKVDRGTYRFVVSAILVMSVFSLAALGQGRQWMRVGDRLLAFSSEGLVVEGRSSVRATRSERPPPQG